MGREPRKCQKSPRKAIPADLEAAAAWTVRRMERQLGKERGVTCKSLKRIHCLIWGMAGGGIVAGVGIAFFGVVVVVVLVVAVLRANRG